MILCCGEALIDMLPRQLPDGSDVYLPVAGGAVFNTAITLGRLGADAGFISGLSSDMFGEILKRSLEDSKVDHSLCVTSPRPTTLAFVKLIDGNAQYQFYDEGSAGRMISADDLPDMPESVSAMHFGAISLIPEPCGSAYEALALREAAKRVISLDPNIRRSFIEDENAHRARLARLIAVADIVKVSDEDLDWLAHGAAPEDTVAGWLSAGTSLVAITRGSDGAHVHTNNGRIDVPARKVEVADTVGAGDSFNGGLLHGLSKAGLLDKAALRKADPEALRGAVELAVQVAAITVSRVGANPPWASELG
ncbi:MAG: carbohydrate kinase [Nitratireductor sp.]|nr:carbohydrate kinase [Nitratireductor sp.]